MSKIETQDKTICELFAGVGGFRLGFEELNSGWETVWFSQWEPGKNAQWAHDCYVQHFGDSVDLNGEYHTNDDISVVDKHAIPDHTLLVGGFPCQDYSVAQSLSTSKGIEGKKGVLWWQIRDVMEAKKPLFCIFENVDRLISSPAKQRGRDFGIILGCLHGLGYSVEWRIVNASKYGGAQKRKRTFIFAYRNDSVYGMKMKDRDPLDIIERDGFMAKTFPADKIRYHKNVSISNDILDVSENFAFNFDNAGYMRDGIAYSTKVLEIPEEKVTLGDILETNVDEKYYLSDKLIEKFDYLKGKKSIPRVSKTGYKYTFTEGSIPFPDKLTEPSRTILTSEAHVGRSTHVVMDPETNRLRKLTPIEVERLQGFKDNWTNTGMSENNRYFCMGNALVVPMVTRMGKTLDSIMEEEIKMDTERENKDKSKAKPFLYDYQMEAVNKMSNGCILCGSVGSGKSRTGLFYYYKENDGWIDENGYKFMKVGCQDLYIITTAKKRDSLEWNGELANFLMSTDPKVNMHNGNKVVVDSWNNIGKYKDVEGAFFLLDEQRIVGSGAWVKSFLKIAKNNNWILLTATPGDSYMDYLPVFLANGFFKNKTEFLREHVVYSRFTKYPKIDKFIGTSRLERLRNKVLVQMNYSHEIATHHEDVYCKYDIPKYKDAIRNRWDPFKNEPIRDAAGLCYILRRIVNADESRQIAFLEVIEDHPKAIVFYNFDYELDILLELGTNAGFEVAQYNGHKHQPVPDSDRWLYLVQYNAGAEGWECIKTNCIIFYSQNYSYKMVTQAAGRIDRLNTPFADLYYYHLKTRSGIDLAISKALKDKKKFNEARWCKWK